MASIVQMLGVRKVIARLQREEKQQNRGLQKGVMEAGRFLQRESQLIVPIDDGILRNSARTDYTGDGKREHEATVSYNTNYAIYVHEDPTASHKPGKVYKYLETPYRENRKVFVVIITETVKRYTRI